MSTVVQQSTEKGGYQCEFTGEVPTHFLCKFCELVARKPHLTDCCGEHFCLTCIDPIVKDKKPCPNAECAQQDFTIHYSKAIDRSIQALEVYCSMKGDGCTWKGKLGDIDGHLDLQTGNCEYLIVECNKCGERLKKQNLKSHMKNVCPKREYSCPHCSFKDTYEFVTKAHYPDCSYYPVDCPNRCGVSGERDDMEPHLRDVCPLQLIECKLNHAGCTDLFKRDDLDRHMEEKLIKHVGLLAEVTSRMSKDIEGLKKENNMLEQKFETEKEITKELTKKLKTVETQMKEKEGSYKQELIEMKQELIKMKQQDEAKQKDMQQKMDHNEKGVQRIHDIVLKEQAERKELLGKEVRSFVDQKKRVMKVEGAFEPIKFMVNNYTQRKTNKESWTSQDFYTHKDGYNLQLIVWCNGQQEGSNAYVSVWLQQKRGEADKELVWPVSVTIILQLLNQHDDSNHVPMPKIFELEYMHSSPRYAGDFSNTFKAHKELEWNESKQTQYLKDDCLRFRIENIFVH